MRLAVLPFLAACIGSVPPPPPAREPPPAPAPRPLPGAPADPATWGQLAHEVDDLVFEGGHVHFEMRWAGDRVIQTARNDFLAPVTIAWSVSELDNLTADTPADGVTVLPGSVAVGATGPTEVLAIFHIDDTTQSFHRYLDFHAQFGDPAARPTAYAYAIPFVAGESHDVIQGAGGSFSHTGGDEWAVDFGCPEGTPVVAARDGVVVAVNDAASGHGTTSEYQTYARTNFVLIAHDDGTLGQYMHFETSGIDVHAGQVVARGEFLGRSGNTGFSTTPHLHFELMTSGADGLSAQSFPFRLQVAPRIVEDPQEGQIYRAWEKSP